MFPRISSLARMRVYAARTLIITSAIDLLQLILYLAVFHDQLGYVVKETAFIWAPAFVFMAVHHTLAVLGPWKPFINAVDLTLLGAEVGCFIYVSVRYYDDSVAFSLPFGFIPRLVALFILFADRIMLAGSALWKGPKYLIKPVKLIPNRERPLITPWQIAFGRHLLSSHLLGETKWIIFPRFILGSTALFFLACYSYWCILLRPYIDAGVWLRQVTTHGRKETVYMQDLFGIEGDIELSLQFTPRLCYVKGSESSTNRSVVNYKSSGRPPQTGSCKGIEVIEGDEDDGKVCVTHDCPFIPLDQRVGSPGVATPQFNLTVHFTEFEPFNPSWIPDMLVTYDFSNPIGPMDEVYVNLTMMKSAQEWGQSIRLTRGSHEVVSYVIDFGDELIPLFEKSFWGLVEMNRNRLAYIREISRSHDTTRNTSTVDSNLGSIRLTRAPQATWTLYEQNFKSDLSDGLSSIGGFWTVLNGIFLIICGRGLLDIAIGHRPLSAVGLLHIFSHKRLRAAATAGYPQVEEDRDNKGLPAMIVDYFAETDHLVKDRRKAKGEESESDEEDAPSSDPLDSHESEPGVIDSEMGSLVQKLEGHHSANDSMTHVALVPLRRA